MFLAGCSGIEILYWGKPGMVNKSLEVTSAKWNYMDMPMCMCMYACMGSVHARNDN